MHNLSTKLLIVGSLILMSFIGWYGYQNVMKPSVPSEEPLVESAITPSLPEGVELEGEGYTVSVVKVPEHKQILPIPDLNRPILFSNSTLSIEQQKQAEQKIRGFEAAIKQNSDDFASWMNLGIYRKSIDDYEGARQAWEYAGLIRPGNSLSFGNLGFLYGYLLKEPIKAEKNYLTAIENDEHLIYLYAQAFEFYRDVLKDAFKAKAIIEQGLKSNPGDEALKALLPK